jgi:hypothetical protein
MLAGQKPREHMLYRRPDQALQAKTPADDHHLDLGGTAEPRQHLMPAKSASLRPAMPDDGT